MLKDTITEFLRNVYSDTSAPAKPQDQKIKLWSLLSSPLKMLFSKSREFLLLSLPFALFMTALSMLLKNSLICGIDAYKQNIVACSPPTDIYFLLFEVLRLAAITFFIKLWYQSAIAKLRINWQKISFPKWHDVKIFLFMIFFIFINFVPVFSYYALLARVPNPDWIIESIYFSFVSVGFVVPFLAILYYVVMSYIIAGEKRPPFRKISAAVFDNAGKIIISTLFIITINLLLISSYIASITPYIANLSIIKAIIFEVFYNITLLIFAASMTNYIFSLRGALFLENQKID